MAESQFIGVIRSAISGKIYAVINPDDDAQLDNPRWLLLKAIGVPDTMHMVKVPRGAYMGALTTEQLETLVGSLS